MFRSVVFRLSKVTDYGIVLLAHLARSGDACAQNTREIAREVDLPAPMVSKVLKSLTRYGILTSQRGSKGGYSLTRPPGELTVAAMIGALEGPLGLTECTLAAELCVHEGSCAVRSPWQVINRVIHDALETVTLADLIDPNFAAFSSVEEVLASVEKGASSGAGSRLE